MRLVALIRFSLNVYFIIGAYELYFLYIQWSEYTVEMDGGNFHYQYYEWSCNEIKDKSGIDSFFVTVCVNCFGLSFIMVGFKDFADGIVPVVYFIINHTIVTPGMDTPYLVPDWKKT